MPLATGHPTPIERAAPVLVAARVAATSAVAAAVLASCAPTVRVEAPREPITINLNVRVDAEVRVKLEEQAAEDIANSPDIF